MKDKIDYLVDAFIEVHRKGITNFKFIILGITKEEYEENFKGVKDLNITNIEFLGKKSHTEVLNALKGADFSIFYRPKNIVTKAGFPTKFVESISCGTPVITNKSSNLSDYFDKYNFLGILIDDFGKNKLTETLINVLEMNKTDIVKLKDECLKNQIFNCNKYVEQFEKLMS
ncbi:glycosyltransferase [Tenacibaculum sp. SG-28]|uniref:glycosyltransferase n=1 Tax=Tenacibaculum sp. SG-28 TaxID=754426 RepID=UPI000CF3A820|nr:glycosyltransferase [Tenacibaculum sp. SG-28]PQJ21098.1 hypothetical protein BSU00_08785 [Tenacibaculum sp. SG-28]